MKLVSIIIPVYNGEKFIEETIGSCLAQTYSNIEVLAINDSSKDNSLVILEKLAGSNDKVKFYTKPNSGMTATRNYGLEHSSGEYVIFLDHDDKLNIQFIENKLKLIEDHDAVGSQVSIFNDSGDIISKAVAVTENLVQNILEYKQPFVTVPGAYLYRREFLDKNKIRFKEYLSSIADKDFLIQLAISRARFALDLSESGQMLYRSSESGFSFKLSEKLVLDNELFYKKLVDDERFSRIDLKKYLIIGHRILYKSFFKVGNYRKFAYYFFKTLI